MQKRLLLVFLCLVLGFGLLPQMLETVRAQDDGLITHEPEERSGGSEVLREFATDIDLNPDTGPGDSSLAPSISTTFDGFNYADNATENSGWTFIPPDPMGAAGTDRLVAVVNVMIEARTKTGTLLWRDALRDFFSSLTIPVDNYLFDPKVIYDHYEGRFLVVALEAVDSGTNPDSGGGNTSRILLAVSKTSSPATATSTDWYYTAINGEESIDGYDCWADYPGFEVDEEAVYITSNMFQHDPYPTTVSSVGSRLWIVNKGTTGGFYAGSPAGVTKHDPYAGGGSAVTTMPAEVYGNSGIGGSGGTYLVSFSGLNSGDDELVQVVRVDNPLGSTTFSREYINVGNIDNLSGSLPDAPQSGTPSHPIEVNDRRALDAVCRNNKLWFTTTINPNSGPDAGQTTAHWFRLDTSAAPGGAITLDDQGNIGGEDIADSTYTFFPSVAINNFGDAIFGFCASASTIYAGAYATAHLVYDIAGEVQASQVVKAGVDYYYRIFGGTRNRWGDYTGAALDPTDDNTVWLFNQYAWTRSGSAPETGRWGTAWASNLFTTWDSYSGGYPDGAGARNDEFDNLGTEHDVYMYGTGLGSSTSYKVVYWDGSGNDVVVESISSDGTGVLKSTHTFEDGVDVAGDWHVTIYTASANPVSYSSADPDIIADDTSFTGGYSIHVAQSAIPEFPTVLAVFVVMALSAGVYLWMRRKTAAVPI